MAAEIVNRDTDPIPPNRNFMEMLRAQWAKGHSICVGLDTDPEQVPNGDVLRFNKEIIDATIDLAGAYKPNSAFYEQGGLDGITALIETVAYIKEKDPSVPVILDAKRGDIGSSMKGYVRSAFDIVGADAITANPYLGRDALEPALERTDKGVFVLAHTSNPGSKDLQELILATGEPLYLAVARLATEDWNKYENCGLVVGATFPEQLALVRAAAPGLPFLVPGVGAQGATLEDAIKNGKDSNNEGVLVNLSRGIVSAPNPRETLKGLTDDANRFRMAT